MPYNILEIKLYLVNTFCDFNEIFFYIYANTVKFI